jgi:hypothetical protein
MELAGNTRSHPVRFDFANNHNKLAGARASMSIAIGDASITSSPAVDNAVPGVPPLIASNAEPKNTRSSQSLSAASESVDPELSFGANVDTIIRNDVLVPEAGTLHYGLLGICLLLAKFRWDGMRDRRIRREMKMRNDLHRTLAS